MFTLHDQNRTYGIELEVVGISSYFAEEVLNANGISVRAQEYNHHDRGYWKIVPDNSVVDTDRGVHGIEIVSPILRGDAGLAEIAKVARVLAEHGATVNATCGFHVHHGASDLSLPAVRALLKRYAKGEELIDVIAGRTDTHYSQSVTRKKWGSARDLFRDIDAAENMRDLVIAYRGRHTPECRSHLSGGNGRCNCHHRYGHINFGTFWSKGTVEFRQHAGCVDAEEICAWVALTQTFVIQATNAMPGLMNPDPYAQGRFIAHLKIAGFGDMDAQAVAYYTERWKNARAQARRTTRALARPTTP